MGISENQVGHLFDVLREPIESEREGIPANVIGLGDECSIREIRLVREVQPARAKAWLFFQSREQFVRQIGMQNAVVVGQKNDVVVPMAELQPFIQDILQKWQLAIIPNGR